MRLGESAQSNLGAECLNLADAYVALNGHIGHPTKRQSGNLGENRAVKCIDT